MRSWIPTSAASLLAAACFVGIANAQNFVGSESCKLCHEDNYNQFRVSGHPYKLHKKADVQTWPIPLPKGYDWDDISYVIGGHSWKIRYMNNDGYIITDSGGMPGNNQYNLATGEWVDYHPGEMKPYDCGKCHTTGFSPTGNQGGLPGIIGTWQFEGIQCEQCHGAGSDHVAAPSKLNIMVDPTAAACGQCHVRGDPATIPASGGFVRHHEQYNELLASPHKNFDCVTCHDPHLKSEFSLVKQCTDCHPVGATVEADLNFTETGRKHYDRGVQCIDCHMPFSAKTAVAFSKYEADIRSHLFEISTDQTVEPFTPDGKFSTGILTGEYSCLGCHVEVVEEYTRLGMPEKAVQWARRRTRMIHNAP